MSESRIPAVFMRGGTSKAVVFHARDLPADAALRDAVFLDVMGSPDPNGRQLDGMGGGVSSLSKVCIVAPSLRDGVDVDFTFAQVAVDSCTVDYAGNCGNMSSAIGPFAVNEGLVQAPVNGVATVRIFNTNTHKLIVSRFPMAGGAAAVEGELALDGVSGTGAPVALEFIDPSGSKTGRLLPAGRPRTLLGTTQGTIEATLVDAAMPCVFVEARALGATGTEPPERIGRDKAMMQRLEEIRQEAAIAMGLAADREQAARLIAVPKVAMVSSPADFLTLNGARLGADQFDVAVRMISVGQPHKASPLTGALCLAVACRVEGSIPHALARRTAGAIRIGHPSGTTVVDARMEHGAARSATVYRTARRLFEGHVLTRVRLNPHSTGAKLQ